MTPNSPCSPVFAIIENYRVLRIFAVALCLVASACGSSTASRKDVPDHKALSDEEFLAKLDAQQTLRPTVVVPIVAETAAPTVAETAAPRVAETAAPTVAETRITEPKAAEPGVTTATFEPVYRAANTMRGATASGVTLVKFDELMQGLSTEIGIAKDHRLNDADKTLLSLYERAFGHYQVSGTLWRLKISTSDELWKGEIPIYFGSTPDDEAMLGVAATYDLPVADRKLSSGPYKSIPADSPQRVWRYAAATLDEATAIYLGKGTAAR